MPWDALNVAVLAVAFAALGVWLVGLSGLVPGLARRIHWIFPNHVVAHDHYVVGELDDAVRVSAISESPGVFEDVAQWNTRTCMLVAAGRYRDALRARPSSSKRVVLRRKQAGYYAIVVINRVEALYNMGAWQRAERLMHALVSSGLSVKSEISLVGGATQLAWIFAATDRLEAAEWWLETLTSDGLPLAYKSEYFMTLAFMALKGGRLDDAARQLNEADALAKRESSRRNIIFLRARVAAAQGKKDDAIELCRAASEHKFKGQGGDGLLFWGDLLSEVGRDTEAKAAWSLAIERDPESESARFAANRLQGGGSPPGPGQQAPLPN